MFVGEVGSPKCCQIGKSEVIFCRFVSTDCEVHLEGKDSLRSCSSWSALVVIRKGITCKPQGWFGFLSLRLENQTYHVACKRGCVVSRRLWWLFHEKGTPQKVVCGFYVGILHSVANALDACATHLFRNISTSQQHAEHAGSTRFFHIK